MEERTPLGRIDLEVLEHLSVAQHPHARGGPLDSGRPHPVRYAGRIGVHPAEELRELAREFAVQLGHEQHGGDFDAAFIVLVCAEGHFRRLDGELEPFELVAGKIRMVSLVREDIINERHLLTN